ncbi:MAG: aldo/keto reductase [Streptococcaceae bacterium]|jgi:diketogulonate reductase-like aldo/keto reductase|nr:aldo/keto reductase [Streptococcaceae bacterium]
METYTLSNGVKIPTVGFGTWQAENGEQAKNSVLEALKAGYRHIDTASAYKNEESVGKAIRESGIPREEIFVTTKLGSRFHSYELAKVAIKESLERLGLDYLDLYLIHWPNPIALRDNLWQEANAGTWQAMEEAYNEGKIRAIGISNFRKHHIEELMKTAKITPQVNQIFLNPSDQQEELVAYSTQLGMICEAYSPLGLGRIFEIKELADLAEKYNKSVAQLVLRWSLQKGFLPLPKSVTPERIAENIQLFDFEITPEDMEYISTSFKGVAGVTSDPDNVSF